MGCLKTTSQIAAQKSDLWETRTVKMPQPCLADTSSKVFATKAKSRKRSLTNSISQFSEEILENKYKLIKSEFKPDKRRLICVDWTKQLRWTWKIALNEISRFGVFAIHILTNFVTKSKLYIVLYLKRKLTNLNTLF